jgi:hypothetical protein
MTVILILQTEKLTEILNLLQLFIALLVQPSPLALGVIVLIVVLLINQMVDLAM